MSTACFLEFSQKYEMGPAVHNVRSVGGSDISKI